MTKAYDNKGVIQRIDESDPAATCLKGQSVPPREDGPARGETVIVMLLVANLIGTYIGPLDRDPSIHAVDLALGGHWSGPKDQIIHRGRT